MKKILVIFLLVILLPSSLQAECDVNHSQWNTDHGLREFFESCLRPINDTERQLFTFGHKNKFERLLKQEFVEFAQFNVPQQNAYVAIKARFLTSALESNAEHRTRFLNGLKSVYGLVSVRQLQEFSVDARKLIDIQNYWIKITTPEDEIATALRVPTQVSNFLTRARKIDLKVTLDITPQAQAALWALALDKVNPGFIDDLRFTREELIELTNTEIDGDPENDIEPAYGINLRRLQGRLLGFTRAKTGGKNSNISYGPAVYLGPLEKALGYYYDENHTGYVCSLPENAQIVDLDNPPNNANEQEQVRPQEILLKNNVFLQGLKNKDEIGLFPFGYNQFSNPHHVRYAMYENILKFGSVYADNGVIDYHQNNVCRRVTLNHFDTCTKAKALISVGLFYGGKDYGRPLYDDLIEGMSEDESGNAIKELKSLLKDCTATTIPNAQRVCVELNDSRFKDSIFNAEDAKSDEKLFDQLRQGICKVE